MNDLAASSGDSKITMFADDTTLINAEKNFLEQEDFESVSNWLLNKKLAVNADKCDLMFFGSGNPQVLKNTEYSSEI